ncbi:PREDICTED: uncharacterized protein LOC102018733 [Chinchilla lanigera]|uniref:uncharacterized protein LOC102018733 n=1 Tax=Chinchilla lanigera TaxID=34839 RepID=UPI00038EA705|nr:PREDICTED: uncharacterized protein LOC102018733 [Chinchilla lanigera]
MMHTCNLSTQKAFQHHGWIRFWEDVAQGTKPSRDQDPSAKPRREAGYLNPHEAQSFHLQGPAVCTGSHSQSRRHLPRSGLQNSNDCKNAPGPAPQQQRAGAVLERAKESALSPDRATLYSSLQPESKQPWSLEHGSYSPQTPSPQQLLFPWSTFKSRALSLLQPGQGLSPGWLHTRLHSTGKGGGGARGCRGVGGTAWVMSWKVYVGYRSGVCMAMQVGKPGCRVYTGGVGRVLLQPKLSGEGHTTSLETMN